MSRFEDLQNGYDKAQKEHAEYYRQCRNFIHEFAESFRVYIGAPDGFVTDPTSNNTLIDRRYVEVVPAIRTKSGEIEYKSLPENQFSLDLLSNNKGGWICGIKLFIDKGINTYPKRGFGFPVEFSVKDGMCYILVGTDQEGETFSIEIQDPVSRNKVFDYMCDCLDNAFTRKPWHAPKKNPIGFTQDIS